MYPVQQQRPAGVSVLAILYFIGGVVWILGALLLLVLFGAFFGLGPTGISAFLAICSGVFIVIGILYFIVGWGLWSLQGWAWTVAIIFAIIGLINFPIGTIISIIILLYLFKPEIKAVFGQGPPSSYPPAVGYPTYGPPGGPAYAPPPWQPYSPPTSPPSTPGPPPAPATGAKNCWNCGAAFQDGQRFCSSCGAKVG